MEKNKITYFWSALCLFIVLVFILNSDHINQQGTYTNIFKPIAENIISAGEYSCDALGGTPLLYPLWGYTYLIVFNLLITESNSILLIIQFVLCLSAISLFYKIYKIIPKYWHIPLLLPFIALMSVKWPDAIAGALLVFFVSFSLKALSQNTIRYHIYGGIILGIILNFRSEYIYLAPFMILLLLLPNMNGKRKDIVKYVFITSIISFIMLMPWAFRSKEISGDYRFSASNGGAVMYISLGQLPGNKWNITPLDTTAYDIAEREGFSSPYSPEANDFFIKKTKDIIFHDPVEYAKKSGYNFINSLIRGVYTSEYANFFITQKRRTEIDNEIVAQSGIINKVKQLFEFNIIESAPLILEKLIQGIYIPVFLALLILFFLVLFKEKDPYYIILLSLTCLIILYKFALISFIQYEYRHMNTIYMFLLGGGLNYIVSKRK